MSFPLFEIICHFYRHLIIHSFYLPCFFNPQSGVTVAPLGNRSRGTLDGAVDLQLFVRKEAYNSPK